jgi:hypothetical protein
MRIDPADPVRLQPAMPDELHDFVVRHRACAQDRSVVGKKAASTARVTCQQLALDEVVPQDFVGGEKSVERARVRFASGEKPDPDRSVDQDRYATRRT